MKQKVDITAFIRELLFGHDCVIVPGFGGFIGNYTPAHIDKNTGTFFPPVKQISFNRNLNHNDGLLAERISGSSNISYSDARNLVDEFVGELRKKLGKGEKVGFDLIGSFVNNKEGNVQFEPDKKANYHLDSYGLESFQCLPLEGYDVKKRIIRHVEKGPVKHAPMRKILWRAAVIVPFLSVLVVVSLKTDLFKTKIEATTLNPLVTAEFEHNKTAVDDGINDESAIIKENMDSVSEEPLVPEIIVTDAIETDIYCLIIGSFKSEENAVSQSNMLIAEGFTPEIVAGPNGFHRVSAMMCTDLGTAIIRKDSIGEKFPGTWISKK